MSDLREPPTRISQRHHMTGKCPICGMTAEIGLVHYGDRKQFNCPRCRHYELTGSALSTLKGRAKDRQTSARLSHSVSKLAKGDQWPLISTNDLDKLAKQPLPKPAQQTTFLLDWIATQAGEDRFMAVEIDEEAIAGVIGAVDSDGAEIVINNAEKRGLIEYVPDAYYRLTPQGWEMIDFQEEPNLPQQNVKEPGRIFIGHGRSMAWRDLKDYLKERLGLEVDEFNRNSTAGISTTERLKTMLNDASFAFLVMTAEDETAAGKLTARLNVVHEIGLFQGRLGFEKAIILLEEGCESFSNIDGLGQIRFPKGKLNAKRDEIREVLEREGIVSR